MQRNEFKLESMPQDVVNVISTHLKYKYHLSQLTQTSTTMHQLVELTPGGQRARKVCDMNASELEILLADDPNLNYVMDHIRNYGPLYLWCTGYGVLATGYYKVVSYFTHPIVAIGSFAIPGAVFGGVVNSDFFLKSATDGVKYVVSGSTALGICSTILNSGAVILGNSVISGLTGDNAITNVTVIGLSVAGMGLLFFNKRNVENTRKEMTKIRRNELATEIDLPESCDSSKKKQASM